MIEIALARPAMDARARVAQWRQLIDLLAQAGNRISAGLRIDVLDRIGALVRHVPVPDRRRAAVALAGRTDSPDLVALFGSDEPTVAAPMLAHARLDEVHWLEIIPHLPPPSRGLLRHRRDLPAMAEHALHSYQGADMVLKGPAPDTPPAEPPQRAIPAPSPSQQPARAEYTITEQVTAEKFFAGSIKDAHAGAASAPAPDAPTAPNDQIRELVDRIETFRRTATRGDGQDGRADNATALPDVPSEAPPPILAAAGAALREAPAHAAASVSTTPAPTPTAQQHAFVFECDVHGVIDRVTPGGPRTALIGMTMVEPAPPGRAGVDGQASGAIRRRAPFRAARLLLGGEGHWAGLWLIDGFPLFNPRDGRFIGYHVRARRPRPGEAIETPLLLGLGLTSDGVQQLAHELRAPLGAIDGFGRMIASQMLGPVAHNYRLEAEAICHDAEHVVHMVDELMSAARLEATTAWTDHKCDYLVPVSTLLSAEVAKALPGLLVADITPALMTVMDGDAFEALLRHVMAIAAGFGQPSEGLRLSLLPVEGHTPARMRLSLERPERLRTLSIEDLLDPRQSLTIAPASAHPHGSAISRSDTLTHHGPALGLAFALRAIANLAARARGYLDITPDAFVIHLPLPPGIRE